MTSESTGAPAPPDPEQAARTEPADASAPEPDDWGSGASFSCKEGALIAVVLLVLAAIVIPNLIEARKSGNETAAIGALKTLGTAQSLFREADKEADGELDYAGNLGELAEAGTTGLIDNVLGSGIKNGYVFRVTHSVTTPEFLWMAVASPAIPGDTGDRTFITNHEGVTYYTSSLAPVPLDPIECRIPPTLQPVGR